MAVHLSTKRIDAGHYKVELIDACRNCKGIGTLDGFNDCPVCNGQGRVKITKDITVSLEPFQSVTTNPKS